MEDKEQFNNYKKEFSKAAMPSMLKDYYKLDGIVTIKTSAESEAAAVKIVENIDTKDMLLKKLGDSLKNLESDMAAVGNSLKQVSHFFSLLQNYGESFSDVILSIILCFSLTK